MIRIVVMTQDASLTVFAGAKSVTTTWTTFDVDAPALEAFMREKIQYAERHIMGVEVLPAPAEHGPAHAASPAERGE